MFDEKTETLVTEGLLKDLAKQTGINTVDLQIDFKNALGEGKVTIYNNEYLECSSDISIKDKSGVRIGDGWMDFLVDENNILIPFWAYFDVEFNGKKYNSSSHCVPDYLWNEFSEKTRNHLAKTHQGWRYDDKLQSYKYKFYPHQLKKLYSQAEDIKEKFLVNLSTDDDVTNALNSLFTRVKNYLDGNLIHVQDSRDSYVIEQCIQNKSSRTQVLDLDLRMLAHLESLLWECQKLFPILSKDYFIENVESNLS